MASSDVEIHYTCLAGRFCRDDLMLVNFLPMGLNVPMYLDNSIIHQQFRGVVADMVCVLFGHKLHNSKFKETVVMMEAISHHIAYHINHDRFASDNA